MLRTTIETTDDSGKELPIPPDLRAKVERASQVVATDLAKLGEKFLIEVRWRFDRDDSGFCVRLDFRTAHNGHSVSVPLEKLKSEDDTRRWLWKPLWALSELLSGELDLELRRIREDLRESAKTPVAAEG